MLLKKEIKKCLFFLFCSTLLVSCETDNGSLAFVIPDNQAEVAEIELSTTAEATYFHYLLLASQLIINWGDKTSISEYVHSGDSWATIRPIDHLYTQAGTYTANIRTEEPFSFDFSKNDTAKYETSITKLSLTNCFTLSELYCRNQPLTELDLSNCSNISVLDIANTSISNLIIRADNKILKIDLSNTGLTSFDAKDTPSLQSLTVGTGTSSQQITNINTLADLRSIYVKGNITETNLNVSANDSLQQFTALNANIEQLNIEQLSVLDTLSLSRCSALKSIKLASNSTLSTIKLVDNTSLSSSALDSIFSTLPLVSDRKGTILLSGNAGDDTCNKSLAIARGWTFE